VGGETHPKYCECLLKFKQPAAMLTSQIAKLWGHTFLLVMEVLGGWIKEAMTTPVQLTRF